MAKKSGNKLRKALSTFTAFLKNLLLLCMQLFLLLIILYRVIPPPVTPLHLVRIYEQIRAGKEIKLTKSWKSIDYVSDKFCLAVITAEDAKFIQHYGFDFEQIQNSIERGFKTGKKLRGASTISQQTAKNLFFTPKRSWIRKVPELFITLTLELFWTKKRILEIYINIIEMGDGVYGAEAAAQHYFKKSAADLNSRESALIAACLPNPRRWKANKPSNYIDRKARGIQRFMHHIGELPWRE
ncbi:MAG: monofunctional biosynthetic peptidoglycan transglycosylase [Bacteroidota bacterium]|jgi:monofunctional biosynthetic peptidoglycan transglycosylase|nr:monofunctional biosynthetic peptidoglycan transglycosylase [Sphingobacteriales bacterium]